MEHYAKNLTSIFRPWDTESKIILQPEEQTTYQDCTISTTTDNDLNENTITTVKSTKNENSDESYKDKPKQQLHPSEKYVDVKQNKKTLLKRKAKDNNDKKLKKLNSNSAHNKTTTQNTQNQSHSEIGSTYRDVYFNVPLIDSHSYTNSNMLFDYPPLIPGVDSVPIPSTIDPLIMESFALHGYAAMEEYVRIMNHEQQTKLLNTRKQRPKKYKCPHCDVGFSNNGQLKGHIRIHTGERPFRCDEKNCGKTFTRNEELTRHKRIHSGLRPFPCNTCGKRFGRKDHLKKHTKTHITANQRNSLQLVPVVLPAGAWASIPPTSGIPMYNPTSPSFHHPHHTTSVFPYATVPTAVAGASTVTGMYGAL